MRGGSTPCAPPSGYVATSADYAVSSVSHASVWMCLLCVLLGVGSVSKARFWSRLHRRAALNG